MSNLFSQKGHSNRRPAVCKKSVPTDCVIGEIRFRVRNYSWEGENAIFVNAVWETPEKPDGRQAEAISVVTAGENPERLVVFEGVEFEFELHPLLVGQACVLVVKVTDEFYCDYVGSQTFVMPANPEL